MEQTKQEIITKLGELNKVVFMNPTAMELHSSRPMLERVHRQEVRRYKTAIEKQKVKLGDDLKKIESYLASIKERETYIASALGVISKPRSYSVRITGKKKKQRDYLESVRRRERYLRRVPLILSQPVIEIRGKPVLKRTRLSRYKIKPKRRSRY